MRYTLIFAILAVLALSACAAPDTSSDTPTEEDTGDFDDMPDDGMAAGTVPEGSENAGDFDDTPGPDVVIEMTGGNYWFEVDGVRNPNINVQQGDIVRINFESIEGFHDVVIDEFNAASEQVSQGGTTFIEFIASETGTFDYYCSVGQHRARGMVGQIAVE